MPSPWGGGIHSLLCSEEVLSAERGGHQVECSPRSSGSEAETGSLPLPEKQALFPAKYSEGIELWPLNVSQ